MKLENKNALIGYTGFIGSNLVNIEKSLDYYNSKNISKIRGKYYDKVYCAGTSSKIWLAKKKPKEDKKKIDNLIENLKRVKANKFFLVSTCEIYHNQKNFYENQKINVLKSYSYGYNRYILELFIQKKFTNHYLIRLPIVYGKNFSKNFLYDLINKNNIDQLNGNDRVQIYEVSNLKKHFQYMETKKISKLNASSSPIKLSFIAKNFFKTEVNFKKKYRKINIKSIYGSKNNNYFLSNKKTVSDLKKFLQK
jgi:hypothetical protein